MILASLEEGQLFTCKSPRVGEGSDDASEEGSQVVRTDGSSNPRMIQAGDGYLHCSVLEILFKESKCWYVTLGVRPGGLLGFESKMMKALQPV